jgi:hypothetical protein
MNRFGMACVLLAFGLAGCSAPADSAGAATEAPSPLGADEAEMREALGDLQVIKVRGVFGAKVAVEVPTKAVCGTSDCAVYAAASFFTYQNDVTQGKLIPQWKALSGDDCYFCADTIAVGEEARAAGASVSGGTLALAEVPTVFTEDWVQDLPPFSDLKRIDGNTVLLSMFLHQSPVTYTPATGEPDVVDAMDATFLVAMQWNGTYWTVETVAIT